jgi:hypothetical protein
MTGQALRLHIPVSMEFFKKLERARAALAHKHPRASTEAILSEGLDLLLQGHAKRKGLVAKPRKTAKAPTCNVHIPAAVKREVWTRDEGKCRWPIATGGICGTERNIQFDHFPVARARGGPSTVENLRLLCASHNQEAARQTFGAQWMSQFPKQGREQSEKPVSPEGAFPSYGNDRPHSLRDHR